MKTLIFSILFFPFLFIEASPSYKDVFQNKDSKKAVLNNLIRSQILQTQAFKKSNRHNQGEFFMKLAQSSTKASKKQSFLEKATLAGGCFWCVESDLEKLYGVKEVISGYSGGDTASPSYKEVSSGTTGHLEAVQVIFDPKIISYSQILDAFWRGINPLDQGGQFVDRGFQYSTAIFYHNEEQKKLAEQSKRELKEKGPFKKEIVTPIQAFKNFYKAEDYHQDYYKKSQIKYRYYRYRSGRDQFLKKTWKKFKDFRPSSPLKEDQKKISHSKEKPSLLGINQPIEKKTENIKKSKSDQISTGLDKANIVMNKIISYSKPTQKEIKNKLTDLQYRVTQKEATEPPFKNLYWSNKKEGIYVDIVSGEPLFSSLDKYDSGTGWPSFTKPLVSKNIVTKKDRRILILRTEVRSKYGDSHLGHLFKDGPPPTGLRYCINSAALRFIPKDRLKKEGYSSFVF